MTATLTAPGPVLVGVDGSTPNASAVAWAAAEASASGGSVPLVLVHDAQSAAGPAGRVILERAATMAVALDRQLTPSSELVGGGPAASLRACALTWERALERESGSALVVVGRRGQGAHRRISLGRTARTLTHQDGPTLVVVPDAWAPGQVPAQAPILVDVGTVGQVPATGAAPGHDPQDTSIQRAQRVQRVPRVQGVQRALGLALARAAREERPLLALASWSVPVAVASQARDIREVWAEHADRAEQALEDLLAPWRSLYPQVALTGTATDRNPVLALLAHAEDTELLVLHRGPRASAVVEYANTPVALV